jgi:hypothetical protein
MQVLASVDEFLAEHAPCVLASKRAALVRIEDEAEGRPVAFGICGVCGITSELRLPKHADREAARQSFLWQLGFRYADLVQTPNGEPDYGMALDLVNRLQAAATDAYADYLSRAGRSRDE